MPGSGAEQGIPPDDSEPEGGARDVGGIDPEQPHPDAAASERAYLFDRMLGGLIELRDRRVVSEADTQEFDAFLDEHKAPPPKPAPGAIAKPKRGLTAEELMEKRLEDRGGRSPGRAKAVSDALDARRKLRARRPPRKRRS